MLDVEGHVDDNVKHTRNVVLEEVMNHGSHEIVEVFDVDISEDDVERVTTHLVNYKNPRQDELTNEFVLEMCLTFEGTNYDVV